MHPTLELHLARRVHPGLTLDVSLSLGDEVGVVFGPSGAGKSSLLRLIAGFDRPDSGSLRLGDEVLFDSGRRLDVPLRRRRIGMIFQHDLLFPHLDVAANIRFGLKGRPRGEVESRVGEVAGLCGVGPLLRRRPSTLSGGERQRVGLARALAPRPRLLLCDEPVSALDLPTRHALIARLREVQRAEAIPVLYVTHSPAEAIAVGSRLFLLRDGRVAAEGPPLEVLASHGLGRESGGEGLWNVLRGVVDRHDPGDCTTRLRLEGGPALAIPFCDRPAGSTLSVMVRADDILLASGPVAGLSARNAIAGVVERVVPHGAEAEVVVRTGSVAWVASLVASAVASLGLTPGREAWLVVKARSIRLLDHGADSGHRRPPSPPL